MKKFGTPMGDGPGSDSEKVGFDVEGTPLPDGRLALDEPVLAFLWLVRWALVDELEVDWLWLEDFCGDDELGCGVVLVVVVLVLPGALECEGEVEVELELVVEDELDELDDVVVVELLEELGAGAHDMFSEATTPLIGRCSDDKGVPGGTSTLNVSVTPPIRVTVTVHESADATGMAAVARTTSMAAASVSTARSRRLMIKLVRPSLPASAYASHASNSLQHACCGGGRY